MVVAELHRARRHQISRLVIVIHWRGRLHALAIFDPNWGVGQVGSRLQGGEGRHLLLGTLTRIAARVLPALAALWLVFDSVKVFQIQTKRLRLLPRPPIQVCIEVVGRGLAAVLKRLVVLGLSLTE